MHESIDLISLHQLPEEQSFEFCPKKFDEYLGQTSLKEKLAIFTQAALMRQEPLDHLLLFGPPGLGKTTLSQIMASVMHVGIKLCSGPMLERTGDLVAILSSLGNRDILFIDEIHRMATSVEEVLYSAMEHFRVDVIIGQGAGAKSVSLPIQPFTLIGATTKTGMLSAPLRSRFGITERLEYYTDEELAQIIEQNAKHMSLIITNEAALSLGKCARGTPRIAKKLLRRVRDFAQVHKHPIINEQIVYTTLNFLGIDKNGLTKVDLQLLEKIVLNRAPIALETLAALIGEDSETIENMYEPFLLRKGLIEKTPRGRQIPAAQLPSLIKKFLGQTTIE